MKETEHTREEILAHEDAFIRGVLQAAEDIKTQTRAITIVRDGQERFSFTVRGLTDRETEKILRDHAQYERSRGGIMLPDLTKARMDLQRSAQIYIATVDIDRAKLWDNPKLQAKILSADELNDLNGERRGATMIDKILYAQEKGNVVEAIDRIGNVEVAETAKN